MKKQKAGKDIKKPNRKLDIIIVLLTIIFGVALVEVSLRILPQKFTKIDFSIIGDNRIFSMSRNVTFKPNNTTVWTGLGEPVVWHFNNLGFRERDIQIKKPDNIFRIVVLGDSVVMGFGVDDYQAYPRKLEELLKPTKFDPSMTHFEVLNMGIQGYSTREYAATLKEDALPLKPNVIIVGVYPSNDLSGTVGYDKDTKYRTLKAIPDLIPYPVNQFLKEHSRAYLFLLNRYYSYITKYESDYKITEKDDAAEWTAIEEDMLKMKNEAAKNNIYILFVIEPNPHDVASKKGSLTQEKMVSLAKKVGVNFYDPLADLQKYPNTKDLYLDDLDDHFSVKGNEYFASLLAKFLWNNNIVPRQPK